MKGIISRRLVFLALLWVISCLPLFSGIPQAFCREVPAYRGYVNDFGDMISPAMEQKLEHTLKSFDESDSTQIAILTIESLEGDSLEDFSIRTVDKWGVGQQGKDNGVLLLAVKKERKIRIEVGQGLEGVLTDLLAGRIVDRVITPRFKANGFDQGFGAGVEAIIQATRGEFTAKSSSSPRKKKRSSPQLSTYLIIGFIVINILGHISKPLGGVAGAIIVPIIVFAGLLLPFGILTLLILIVLGGIIGLFVPLMSGHYYGGGGGGFSSGGGGGGFGGFGGGSFGGGGAGGSW